jgi:hypothetical protein
MYKIKQPKQRVLLWLFSMMSSCRTTVVLASLLFSQVAFAGTAIHPE